MELFSALDQTKQSRVNDRVIDHYRLRSNLNINTVLYLNYRKITLSFVAGVLNYFEI